MQEFGILVFAMLTCSYQCLHRRYFRIVVRQSLRIWLGKIIMNKWDVVIDDHLLIIALFSNTWACTIQLYQGRCHWLVQMILIVGSNLCNPSLLNKKTCGLYRTWRSRWVWLQFCSIVSPSLISADWSTRSMLPILQRFPTPGWSTAGVH